MDRDNNGALTRQELDCEEFYAIVRAVLLPAWQAISGMGGPAYTRSVMDMDQAINFALRKADLNDDNKLSFEEFKAFMVVLRQPQLATHTANLIFALFDVNRDGWVDEFEFRQIYRFYLGHVPTETEFQDEWALLDSANRGRVSRDEYVKWLQGSSNVIFREHSPQLTSKIMSGSADHYHYQPPVPGLSRAAVRTAATSQAPWRPWHAYTHMGWAQVRQGAVEAGDLMQRSKSSMSSTFVNAPTQRLSRSAVSLPNYRPRPPFNNRIATNADSRIPWTPQPLPEIGGDLRGPTGMRDLLSMPQSTEELGSNSVVNSGKPSVRQQSRYSQESAQDRARARNTSELLPNRSKFRYGRMKNPKTGQRQYWKDSFLSPPQLREKYVSGSNSLRCMGAAPRYMTVDEYENPE
jgi:hypothetical protein